MSVKLPFLILFFAASQSFAASIQGAWQSDCQNVAQNPDGYLSIKPVDSFLADGNASLRVHVFERRNCLGKEWDQEIIPCTYVIGKEVLNLPNTKELNLECKMDGKIYHWYEIAEVTQMTVRFGNQTGNTPEERPKSLGSVFYRRLN